MESQIDFWFDFSSAYSYPSVMRIETLAHIRKTQVHWKPFHTEQAICSDDSNAFSRESFEVNGNKMWADMERLCKKYELPLVTPQKYHRGSLFANRVAYGASAQPWIGKFCRTLMTLQFAYGRNIEDELTVREALHTCVGEDCAIWLNLSETQQVKSGLEKQVEKAESLGIYGTTAFVVGSELFCGKDRLDNVTEFLTSGSRQATQLD